jgi:hypothetical protein
LKPKEQEPEALRLARDIWRSAIGFESGGYVYRDLGSFKF